MTSALILSFYMRNHILPLSILSLLLVAACAREPVAEQFETTETPAFQVPAGSVPGVIRVKFKSEPTFTKAGGPDLSALGAYTMTRTFPPAGKWEARHREAGLHLWYDIHFDSSVSLTKAGQDALATDAVEVVEYVPEARTKALSYPFNDPRLPEQWHYYNPGGKDQWKEGCDVNAIKAWTLEVGKPEVIVAVNDNGVDYAHEDLAANMWVNQAELNGKTGEDDDNNGYVDDIYGYSFMVYSGSTSVGKIDPGDHGTHVAGTIAAVNNNGIGVSGIAGGDGTPGTGARIMVTQTLDELNHAANTAESFIYAADNGAVLVNCSWGFTNYEAPTPQSVREAIDYFNKNAGLDENGQQVGPMIGGLVIFAAGNDGREVEHPAMDDNVFSVAALSANYVRSYFTSFGEWIDISAPGGDANRQTYVLSTIKNNQYGNKQGSSMAAPHVTGVAALIVSHYGVGHKGFTRDKLIYLMQSTANKKALEENGSYATRLGAGLIDAYAALTAESSDVKPNPVNDLTAAATGNRIDLSWTIPADIDGYTPYAYSIFYSKNSLSSLDPAHPGEDVKTLQVYGAGKTSGTALTGTLTGLDFNTTYHFRICSANLMGTSSDLSAEKTCKTGSNSKPVIKALDGTSLTLSSCAKGSLRFELSDPDGHDLTWSLSKDLDGVTPTLAGGVLTLAIDALEATDNKTYNGVLSVSDGHETTTLAFSYTILKNNAPVVVAQIEDQIFASISESHVYDLTKYFSDPDGDALTFDVKQSTTSIIVKPSLAGKELTLTGHSLGGVVITVTAVDGRGASVSQSFNALVRDASRAFDIYPNPVVDKLNIRPGQEGQLEVTVTNKVGATVWSGSAAAGPFDPMSIDLSKQPGGVYYVRVQGAGVDESYTIAKK